MSVAWLFFVATLGMLIGLVVGIVRGGQTARIDNRADFDQIAAEWDRIVADREDMQRTYRAMAEEAATGGTTA